MPRSRAFRRAWAHLSRGSSRPAFLRWAWVPAGPARPIHPGWRRRHAVRSAPNPAVVERTRSAWWGPACAALIAAALAALLAGREVVDEREQLRLVAGLADAGGVLAVYDHCRHVADREFLGKLRGACEVVGDLLGVVCLIEFFRGDSVIDQERTLHGAGFFFSGGEQWIALAVDGVEYRVVQVAAA